MNDQRHILILDDDPTDAFLLRRALSRRLNGGVFYLAENREQYFGVLQDRQLDAIISDSSVLGLNALEAFSAAQAQHSKAAFFIFSGSIKQELATLADKAGVRASIEKHRMDELVGRIAEAVERRM